MGHRCQFLFYEITTASSFRCAQKLSLSFPILTGCFQYYSFFPNLKFLFNVHKITVSLIPILWIFTKFISLCLGCLQALIMVLFRCLQNQHLSTPYSLVILKTLASHFRYLQSYSLSFRYENKS